MKRTTALLGLVTLGSLLVGGQVANAEDAVAGDTQTLPTVTFSYDKAPVNPVGDPKDPTKPSDPDATKGNNGKTNNTPGDLLLDYISNFEFGPQTFHADGSNEFSATQDNKHSNFAQISDKRGTQPGWSLSAKMTSPFTNDADEANILKAATIKITGETPLPIYNDDKITAPTIVTDVTIGDNVATPIMNAAAGSGLGTWVESFSNVQLSVPRGEAVRDNAAYTATIQWTLSTTPTDAAPDTTATPDPGTSQKPDDPGTGN